MPRPRALCALTVTAAVASSISSSANAFTVGQCPSRISTLGVRQSSMAKFPGLLPRQRASSLCMNSHNGGLGVTSTEGEGGGELWTGATRPERPSPGLQERWQRLQRSLLHGAISMAAFTFGATAVFSGVHSRLGVDVPGATAPAEASIFKPFNKRTVQEKLANLPAFMVLAVFYTNLDDARDVLQEMAQSPYYAKDARILVVGLDKAFDMCKAGQRSTGYKSRSGQEDMMSFKLHEDISGLDKAARLGLVDVQDLKGEVTVPVFYAEGLEVKRDGGMVKPLFMDPADLVKAWKKAAQSNKEMPGRPDVKVFSLPEVVLQMESSDDYAEFGFFPSTEAGDFIVEARKAGRHNPRLRKMLPY